MSEIICDKGLYHRRTTCFVGQNILHVFSFLVFSFFRVAAASVVSLVRLGRILCVDGLKDPLENTVLKKIGTNGDHIPSRGPRRSEGEEICRR